MIADSHGEPFFQSDIYFMFKNKDDIYEINQFIREDLGMKFKMPYVMINFCNFYGFSLCTRQKY